MGDHDQEDREGGGEGREPAPLASLRARVTAEIGALLDPRRPRAASVVLGAGNDDLEAGRRFLAALAPGGYAVPAWPRQHGGMGLGEAEAEVVSEVLAGFDTPDLYPFLVGLGLIGPAILAHGSDEQKRRWLPPMRSGQEIWCQMFSEPDAGSDLANLSTRAVPDGAGWRLTGSKVWTSRAHYSRWGMALARTDFSVPKHRGISTFVVDMEAPGVSVRPLVQMNGDAHFNEVFLDDVRVSGEDLLGERNGGWRVAITALSHERGSLAGTLGLSSGQLLDLARTAEAASRPVARDRLMRAVSEHHLITWTGLRDKAARQAGREPGPEGSGAKLRTNHMIKAVADLAVDVEGPAATVVDGTPDKWQTLWLAAPSVSIRGGTDEIQRNILGERVLGLPPEPRVDKDRPFSER